MNKQIIIGALVVVLMAVPTLAVDVDCDGWGWMNTDICQDWELQDEFDEVTDMIDENANDIVTVGGEVYDVQMTINNNNAKWSQDSSGTSMSSVRKYLFGDYFDYIFSIFTPRDEFNALEDKLYLVEAQLFFVENDMEYDDNSLLFKAVALEMEAHQTTKVNHGKYSCSVAGEKIVCVG